MDAFQLNQVVKTQHIRMIDVFVLGPLMIYAATLVPKKHGTVRLALGLFGASTIVYNWQNHQKVAKLVP